MQYIVICLGGMQGSHDQLNANQKTLAYCLCRGNLSPKPIKSLIPPSGEVNTDDLVDKSSSKTSVQPVTLPNAPTDKKTWRKGIPLSSKLEASHIVQEQIVKKEVKGSSLNSMGDVTFKQLMDKYDQKQHVIQEMHESPYDTESEIKVIKRFQPTQTDDEDQIIFLGPVYDDMHE
ncbi:hypothetical protein Tco_1012563 [Tanacetum coccineum]